MWSTDGCPCTLLSPKIARIAMKSIESKLCSLCLNVGYLKFIFCRSLWIDAFGFHTKWRKDLEVKSWKCLLKYNKKGVAIESANSRLSLRQLFAAFIILIIGYLIAFVAFILERFFLANEVIDVWWLSTCFCSRAIYTYIQLKRIYMVMGLLLSRKNVRFFPEIFVGKEAQRQNVGFCLEGQKQNSFFTKL